jgi:ribosome-binding protein aMBF1 (putative translation factor)
MSRNKHVGSDFDAFLVEQGELDGATAIAVKRVIAWQIEQAMQSTGVSKSALAKRMRTSRTVVDRMLDATDTGLTLETMTRAAMALGFKVRFDLIAA